MKRRIQKKLSLNKKTITTLAREEMANLQGGSWVAFGCLSEEQYTLLLATKCCGNPTGDNIIPLTAINDIA